MPLTWVLVLRPGLTWPGAATLASSPSYSVCMKIFPQTQPLYFFIPFQCSLGKIPQAMGDGQAG